MVTGKRPEKGRGQRPSVYPGTWAWEKAEPTEPTRDNDSDVQVQVCSRASPLHGHWT